jgi:anti-sigma factor (TIGR02949 family)
MSTQDDSCDSIVEHLYEYLDSEMTPEDTARMREHVAECSPCLAELGIDEMVKRLLRRSCAERAPEHLRIAIHMQISTSSTSGPATGSGGC